MSGNLTLNSFFSTQSVQTDFFERLSPFAFQGVNDILSDIFSDFAQLFDLLGGNQFGGNNQDIAPGGCVCPPVWDDCTHPQGSLQTDGKVITTPGGYKIEPIGQFEWKITGPDGKSTRVWGDPHVDEGDGGKWDFIRNSTFVLGDGTRVNVTTKPYGNGATVTSGLEIISGNDRVTVSGIDKGKGVIGQITQDGYAHSNSFSGDVFVMGRETDDWSHQGREIIGSNNGGQSFILGNQLPAGNPYPWRDETNPVEMIKNFDSDMFRNWNQNWRPNRFGLNPYYDNKDGRNDFRADSYDCGRHQRGLRRAFRLFAELFRVLARLTNLSDQMYSMRTRTMYA